MLNASREDSAWVVAATLLAATVAALISGRLGAMYGKRRIVLVLLAAMIVGSVIAALSTSLIWVIVHPDPAPPERRGAPVLAGVIAGGGSLLHRVEFRRSLPIARVVGRRTTHTLAVSKGSATIEE